jgi:hypothetical protein
MFELFLMALFDGLLFGLCWPFLRKHYQHHIARDNKEAQWSGTPLRFPNDQYEEISQPVDTRCDFYQRCYRENAHVGPHHFEIISPEPGKMGGRVFPRCGYDGDDFPKGGGRWDGPLKVVNGVLQPEEETVEPFPMGEGDKWDGNYEPS